MHYFAAIEKLRSITKLISDMAKKEFKIGEVFQFGFVKLRVEMYDENSLFPCGECFFSGSCCINRIEKAIGSCEWENREDKTNVIFVKVEE